uniref:DUF727 domain-containing protein n=1 Tax=Parastrongyloides trichosuri TaxID=131310 RepID=A0A0N4ZK71_PARTI
MSSITEVIREIGDYSITDNSQFLSYFAYSPIKCDIPNTYYFNVTTLEDDKFTLQLDISGWSILSEVHDKLSCDNQRSCKLDHSKKYEDILSFFTEISELFRDKRMELLCNKLIKVQEE